MRSRSLLLALTIVASSGCAARQPARVTRVPVEALFGTYELVSIEGRALPVREFQAVYHAGRITLSADRRYSSEIEAETCSPDDVCTRGTTSGEGTWLVREDGTIEFDPPEEDDEHLLEDAGPPPRIEADGKEIRYYTPSVDVPIFRYRRR